MPDWAVALLMLWAYAHGAVTAWAFAHDGKSSFWTSYLDGATLRYLWRK